MRFTIDNLQLIKALKLMQGFTAKSLKKPILTKVHIVADALKQTVCFEATDSFKAVKWYVDAEVIEDGEDAIEIQPYMLSLLKFYKAPTAVTIYEENDDLKAKIDSNIIKLNNYYGKLQDKYPNTNSVYNVEALDSKPLIDIKMLQSALKAMASAGAKYVELNIQQQQSRAIKLIASKDTKKEKTDIEAILLPVRKWDD